MTGHAKSLPWRVVRQTSSAADVEVSTHRFGFVAELCAHRRSNREQDRGVFYSATRRPAGEAS